MQAPNASLVGQSFAFHLSGNLKNSGSYEITVKPNESPSKGLIHHEKETREVDVETKHFPNPVTLQKISEAFFELLPQIKVSFTRGGIHFHRHLEVVWGEVSASRPVKVTLILEGTGQNGRYLIHLDPIHLAASKAWKKGGPGTKDKAITLNLGDYNHVSVDELKQMLLHFDTRLNMEIDPPDETLTLRDPAKVARVAQNILPSAHPPVNSPSKPHNPVSVVPSILSVSNATCLSGLLATPDKQDPFAYQIAHAMVNDFTQARVPSEEELIEITQLFEGMSSHDGFRILNTLMNIYDTSKLKDEQVIRQLTSVLVRYQQVCFKKTLEAAIGQADNTQPGPDELFDTLDPAHLVAMLESLTQHLAETHTQKGNVELAKAQLQATIALLDVMTLRKVENIDKTLHEKAYKAIAKFDDSEDLYVLYLANYGKQAFTLIPNDETNTKSFFNRTFYVLRGLAKVADAVSPLEPWHIVSAFEAVPDFKKAFSFQQRVKNWFVDLCAMRALAFRQSPAKFIALISQLNKNYQQIKEEIDFQNPFFVAGVIELVREIINFPSLDANHTDLKIEALNILMHIYLNNAEGTKEEIAFRVEKNAQRVELQEKAFRVLWQDQNHLNLLVKKRIQEILTTLKPLRKNLPRNLETKPEIPTELFDRALKRVAPLLISMHRAQKNLESEPQLIKERPYYVAVDTTKNDWPTGHTLQKDVKDFLNAKDGPKALLVEAEGGAGKSLGMKVIAQELLNEYTLNGYFPIFVSLPAMRDPVSGAIRQTLEDLGLDREQIDELKKRKVVWIFDAYDEINFTLKSGGEANIWVNNDLEHWPNARCIFTCKKGTHPPSRFTPRGSPLQVLGLEGFNEEKIFEYLDQYVREKQKDGTYQLLWTAAEYKANFAIMKSTLFWDIISNPFRLKITADAFPIIVREYLRDHPHANLQEIFRGQDTLVITNKLFEVYACINARRSSQKTDTGVQVPAVKYLEYSAKLAARMEKEGIYSIPWGTDDESIQKELTVKFGDLFSPPHDMMFKEVLVPKLEGWSFIHGDYREYCTMLGQNPRALRTIIDRYSQFEKLYGHD